MSHRGRGRGRGRNNKTSNSSNRVVRNPQEVERENVRILSDNFNSSGLSYKVSDTIVSVPYEDGIQSIWRRSLKKGFPNQHHIRRFLNSCLAATSENSALGVDELITNLSESDGRQRLRDIIMFPVSVDAGTQPQVASFQRVTLPFLALLTRSGIVDSILESKVNAIYQIIYSNLDDFISNKVIDMLEILVQRNSIADQRASQDELLKDDPDSFNPTTLGQFFLVIVRICDCLLNRFKDVAEEEAMYNIVQRLEKMKTAWLHSFQTQQENSNDPLYSNIELRNYYFHILDKEFNNVKRMIRKRTPYDYNSTSVSSSISYKERSRIVDLKRSYDPPGELSEQGPRHDNDFSDISKISIIPTKEEMLSLRPPFLPTNIPGAPHFLPEGASRLFDTQFRLLREDMLSPIRGGIINFLRFIADPNRNDRKLKKYQEVGGRFRHESDQDNGDLYIYSNVRFVAINVDKRRGFSCRVAFNPPKNVGKSKRDRLFYWQRSKKLMNGNLVCLLWPTEDDNKSQYSLFFGIVLQRDEDKLANHGDRVEIDISFSDAAIYPLALKNISNQKKRNMIQNTESNFMVESTGVYLESYYHILKTLQNTNNSLPFEKYLTLDENQIETTGNVSIVDIPDYARAPGFRFDLSVLLDDKQKQLYLNVSNTNEHENAIKELTDGSKLDYTQAKALVSSLCKEIALIEGPPGTGKTVVGVEIMKVLLAKENRNIKLTPIFTICFTNHALDQFLEHLLDKAGIDNIVRLGGRTKSDKIAPFNLEEIARNREKPTGIESYNLAMAYEKLESIQKEADKIQKKLDSRWLRWKGVSPYLSLEFNEHYKRLSGMYPSPSFLLDDDLDEEWKTAGRSENSNKTLFEKWLHGVDIKNAKLMIQMENSRQQHKKTKQGNSNINSYNILNSYDDDLDEIYEYLSDEDDDEYEKKSFNDINTMRQDFLSNWQEPNTNRPLEELKDDPNIWEMSKTERIALHDFWRQELNLENVEDLAKLQKAHDEKRKEVEDIHCERRKKILKECDVIGMTTNGAAKFQSLIRSVNPKVIICEEAGEVLEAHILSALTPSTQHLILIGDHNQLRPRIATYSLSCDSKTGEKYGLDKSLFERLVKGDKATRIEKSQLLTQRRMRAEEISGLIRNARALPDYKPLIDGENTKNYPKVRGAQHNVYFINHRNPEDKGKNEFAIQSHSNQYEVDMVIEMVKYFVRNGYTKQDDIAVLTPYLGQMMKLRDALKAKFTVVIDERDSQNLAEMEDDKEDDDEDEEKSDFVENISVATKKSLNQQVTLRTVDNFQGEEANIVIISLVRNSFGDDDKGSIGFLKSTNRSNVLLSRAKHGMYLLGNAELMANKSPGMWGSVVQMLNSRNQVGDSFPIVCPQHPNNRNNVKHSGQFDEFAPDGGCLESCGQKLECGHLCPYKCHSDNPKHTNVFCRKNCTRLYPECNHPCNKFCGEKCGDCTLIIGDITLPSCGHIYPKAKCNEVRNVESIRCRVNVLKTLPKCGHNLEMKCYESVDEITCKQPCGMIIDNCGHNCSATCNECQKRSIKANNDEPPLDENGYIKRNTHGFCKKVCERNLFCGHKCEDKCHKEKNCKPCKAKCTVSCSHSTCKLECFKPCTSCAEPCDWNCPHGKGKCLLSCGAPCSRLPCNSRCEKTLKCGHPCPGVCGEVCPKPKFCQFCAPDDVKEQMIDYYEFKKFSEIDWEKERMIILECGHVFTMETMDHHMEMEKYYEGNYDNWTGIKMLSSKAGENKIMTCPNCRAPIIKIKRYGRSIKHRILDTQNKKFLIKYDIHLKFQKENLEASMKKMENNRPALLEKFKQNRVCSLDSDNSDKNIVESNKIVPEVATIEQFYQIDKYNSIPESHASYWKKHTRELLKSYQQLMMIMSHAKNPPYKKAFEAAVTRLYHEKSNNQIDLLAFNNFEIIETESPESQKERFEQSLREVGIIAPQFDRRIYLDAFMEIVNTQKVLFHEATRIISELPIMELQHEVGSGVSVLATRKRWIRFGYSIINSIKGHLEIIIKTCKETSYRRHLTLSLLELAEFEYLVVRFFFNNLPNNIMNDSNKEEIKKKCDKIHKDCEKILNENLPSLELEYFQGQCVERINKLLTDVDKFYETVERSGPLTQIEKLEIYRAMSSEFNGSGHWYECPNGHPYTIGECGGPMETRRCPDCGVTIGGGDHLLNQGNRRNAEFEAMGGGNSRTTGFW